MLCVAFNHPHSPRVLPLVPRKSGSKMAAVAFLCSFVSGVGVHISLPGTCRGRHDF